jgi:hypothetical protein
MDDIGVMLYGFDEPTARKVKDYLEEKNQRNVVMISGSAREGDTIAEILGDEEHSLFEDRMDPKIVMFLGFDGPGIHASMDSFPSFEGMKRPIFCTPTEQNIGWPLKDLIKDLLEEREYFQRMDRERTSGK